MDRPRQFFLVLFVGLLTWLAASHGSFLFAQSSRTGLSPEDQKKYDELMRSARQDQSIGVLAMQVGAGFCGLALLYGAYSTFRYGLKITEGKRIEGTGAQAIAAILVLLAVALAVAGILFAPSVMP